MFKIFKKVILIVAILFLVYWGCSVLRCEILTYRYGHNFDTIYKKYTMMGDPDYLKVLDYSDNFARVYYVSENRCGNIVTFEKTNGKWQCRRWEKTVWSKGGSADDFMWPYVR